MSQLFGDLKVRPLPAGDNAAQIEILNRIDQALGRMEAGTTKFATGVPNHLQLEAALRVAAATSAQSARFYLENALSGLPYVNLTVNTGKVLRLLFLNGDTAKGYAVRVVLGGGAAIAVDSALLITITAVNGVTTVADIRALILAHATLKYVLSTYLVGTTATTTTVTLAAAATAPTSPAIGSTGIEENHEMTLVVGGNQLPLSEVTPSVIVAYVPAYSAVVGNAVYDWKARLSTGALSGTLNAYLTHMGAKHTIQVPFVTALGAAMGGDDLASVKDFHDATVALPVAPVEGDRWICSGTGNGWTIHYLYTRVGAAWNEYIPDEGDRVAIEGASDAVYVFTGTIWADLATVITHASLKSLQGGSPGEYYHLTSTQYTNNLLTQTNLLAVFAALTAPIDFNAQNLTEAGLIQNAASTVVAMGGLAHALVVGTAGAAQTKLLSNTALVTPGLGAPGSAALTLPAVGGFIGSLQLTNVGPELEHILVNATWTMRSGETWEFFSDGVAWRAKIVSNFFAQNLVNVGLIQHAATTVVAMGGVAHALVVGTAGAAQTKLLGNVALVTPGLGAPGSANLTLPLVGTFIGSLQLRNVGPELEHILVNATWTIRSGETWEFFSDGLAWRAMVAPNFNAQNLVGVGLIQNSATTSVAMGGLAHTLVLGAAGAAQTKLVGNVVLCNTELAIPGSVALTLPAVGEFVGALQITNTSDELEHILVNATWTIRSGETWEFFSDGLAWRAMIAPNFNGQNLSAVGAVRNAALTTVDMANVAHALVMGAPGANETKLISNVVLCDPNSGGASEILTLPAFADFIGTLTVINTGGESIVVLIGADNVEISAGGYRNFVSTGAAWRAGDGTKEYSVALGAIPAKVAAAFHAQIAGAAAIVDETVGFVKLPVPRNIEIATLVAYAAGDITIDYVDAGGTARQVVMTPTPGGGTDVVNVAARYFTRVRTAGVLALGQTLDVGSGDGFGVMGELLAVRSIFQSMTEDTVAATHLLTGLIVPTTVPNGALQFMAVVAK